MLLEQPLRRQQQHLACPLFLGKANAHTLAPGSVTGTGKNLERAAVEGQASLAPTSGVQIAAPGWPFDGKLVESPPCRRTITEQKIEPS